MSWGAVAPRSYAGVARPIARRRAGLLGWVAPPNGGINSLVLASGCCLVRFDLDHSLFSGLESKAAGKSVRSTQTSPPGAPPIRALPLVALPRNPLDGENSLTRSWHWEWCRGPFGFAQGRLFDSA
jgi:hypothetical protein